jgi:hypothetical protein
MAILGLSELDLNSMGGYIMKLENLYIVFVGVPNRGSKFEKMAEAHGWTVKSATELIPALAECAFYTPDLVILDNFLESELSRSVFYHLRSIDFQPFLALNDSPGLPKFMHLSALSFMQMLDSASKPEKMFETITELVIQNRKSSSRRHVGRYPTEKRQSSMENWSDTKSMTPCMCG